MGHPEIGHENMGRFAQAMDEVAVVENLQSLKAAICLCSLLQRQANNYTNQGG